MIACWDDAGGKSGLGCRKASQKRPTSPEGVAMRYLQEALTAYENIVVGTDGKSSCLTGKTQKCFIAMGHACVYAKTLGQVSSVCSQNPDLLPAKVWNKCSESQSKC